MKYLTEAFCLDKDFPFAIFRGNGFSAEKVKNGKVYMHNHYCLEINLTLSSGGTYYITDESYNINKGDIFIINNYEYHYAANTSDKMELLVIIFDPELVWQNEEMDYLYIKSFYEWKDGFKHRISAKSVPGDIVDIIFEMEREWAEKSSGYRLIIKSLLLKLLALLYRKFEEVDSYSSRMIHFRNKYLRIIDSLNYIDNNFALPLTLTEISSKSHMNKNYFSTYFKDIMNCTVSEYIIRKRLKHACLMLASTDKDITEIALENGFKNISYFNRTFKKHIGMTPGMYRKSAKT